MRIASRTPVLQPPDEQPDQNHTAGVPETHLAAAGALTEPQAATRWAASPLLRSTSPLTAGRRWNEL